MSTTTKTPIGGNLVDLRGKRGLVIGIANEHSIAAGCAEVFAAAGARLAATYLNAKAEPFVRGVTDRIGCELVFPSDVLIPGRLEDVFDRIRTAWGAWIACSIPLRSRRAKTCVVA